MGFCLHWTRENCVSYKSCIFLKYSASSVKSIFFSKCCLVVGFIAAMNSSRSDSVTQCVRVFVRNQGVFKHKKKFKWCLRKVLMVFCFKEFSRVFLRVFLRMIHGCFKVVSSKFQGCFKKVSETF